MSRYDDIKKQYQLAFDELNILKKDLRNKPKNEALDDFIDYLLSAYAMGSSSIDYTLDIETMMSGKSMDELISKEYDGVSIIEKFNDYYDKDTDELDRLVDSEWHRAYMQGSYDSAKQSPTPLKKRWVTMGDEKVRDTHFYLEGVTKGIDEYFNTYDGDKALFPSGFNKAENNANCRCFIEYIESD